MLHIAPSLSRGPAIAVAIERHPSSRRPRRRDGMRRSGARVEDAPACPGSPMEPCCAKDCEAEARIARDARGCDGARDVRSSRRRSHASPRPSKPPRHRDHPLHPSVRGLSATCGCSEGTASRRRGSLRLGRDALLHEARYGLRALLQANHQKWIGQFLQNRPRRRPPRETQRRARPRHPATSRASPPGLPDDDRNCSVVTDRPRTSRPATLRPTAAGANVVCDTSAAGRRASGPASWPSRRHSTTPESPRRRRGRHRRRHGQSLKRRRVTLSGMSVPSRAASAACQRFPRRTAMPTPRARPPA